MAKISKNELGWVDGFDHNGNLRYTITSNEDRSWYYIYDANGNRLGKAKTPIELKDKYFREDEH